MFTGKISEIFTRFFVNKTAIEFIGVFLHIFVGDMQHGDRFVKFQANTLGLMPMGYNIRWVLIVLTIVFTPKKTRIILERTKPGGFSAQNVFRHGQGIFARTR